MMIFPRSRYHWQNNCWIVWNKVKVTIKELMWIFVWVRVIYTIDCVQVVPHFFHGWCIKWNVITSRQLWEYSILRNEIQKGNNVLLVAHTNLLHALMQVIDGIYLLQKKLHLARRTVWKPSSSCLLSRTCGSISNRYRQKWNPRGFHTKWNVESCLFIRYIDLICGDIHLWVDNLVWSGQVHLTHLNSALSHVHT